MNSDDFLNANLSSQESKKNPQKQNSRENYKDIISA
jgi:hypothetical protein